MYVPTQVPLVPLALVPEPHLQEGQDGSVVEEDAEAGSG